MSHRTRILGLPPHYYCTPVREPLLNHPLFTLRTDAPALLALQLRERKLDAALLTPSDYARDSSDYLIVPTAAISSRGPGGAITLHFRKGVRSIRRLAVDPSSASEIILARILLAEEFDSFPVIIPVAGALSQMLERADAALLVGDAAQVVRELRDDAVDLVEAWNELTGLPYVYGLWCGREKDLSSADVLAIQGAHRGAEGAAPPLDEQRNSPVAFTYLFGKEVEEGLQEFLHYSFYHGILPDVPDPRYFQVSHIADDSLPPDIGRN